MGGFYIFQRSTTKLLQVHRLQMEKDETDETVIVSKLLRGIRLLHVTPSSEYLAFYLLLSACLQIIYVPAVN